MTDAEFVAAWERRRAVYAETSGLISGETACQLVLAEFYQLRNSASDECLTIAGAALRTGRSRDTISRALADGRLTNCGRKGKPLVRTGELLAAFPPRAQNTQAASSYDVDADASRLMSLRR